MKKLLLLLTLILCLTSCSSPKNEPTPVEPLPYDHTETSIGAIANFEFASNRTQAAALCQYGKEFDAGLYHISAKENILSYEKFGEVPLTSPSLLGMDGDGCVWVSGFDEKNQGCVTQINPQGEPLLSFTYSGPPYSFTWDENYYYLLLDDYSLAIYTHDGSEVFKQDVKEYSVATLGYLDVEEEWMEELEGREGDPLYEFLFPAGPADTFQLTRLYDGTPTLIIRRDAPIGSETWDLICPIDTSSFTAAPVFAYEVQLWDTFRVSIPVESQNEAYDLMVVGLEGLSGISLDTGKETLLIHWDTADYPIGYQAPVFPHTATLLQSGIIMQHNENTDEAIITYLDYFIPHS